MTRFPCPNCGGHKTEVFWRKLPTNAYSVEWEHAAIQCYGQCNAIWVVSINLGGYQGYLPKVKLVELVRSGTKQGKFWIRRYRLEKAEPPTLIDAKFFEELAKTEGKKDGS